MYKVLFIFQTSSIGGGSYCLLNILKELDRKEIAPMVLLKGNGPLVEEINKLGIEVKFFPEMTIVPYNEPLYKPSSWLSYLNVYKSIKNYKKLLTEIKPDAVYLNTMMLYPYLKPAKELGVKTVIHLREHWPLDEHKVQLGVAQKTISQWADQIVAINSYSASMIPDRNSTIVYDWIEMDSRYEERPFDEIFQEDTSNLKVFLFTGTVWYKGIYEVLDCFVNHMKDPSYRLLMLGHRPSISNQGLRNKVKRILSIFGIKSYAAKLLTLLEKDNRIVYIPPTYNLTHIIQQSYCCLSYFRIPHANLALAEGIICGVPTVAAETPESLEYSMEGKLSVLFKMNDFKDFVAKVEYLIRDQEKIKQTVDDHKTQIRNMFDRSANSSVLNNVLIDLFK